VSITANKENSIIISAIHGGRDAFETLVRQCAEQIFNLSFRLTGNSADAEDLTQSAFVQAYKNISKFRADSSFSSWVYRITLNLWKNKIKSEKRHSILKFFSLDGILSTEDGEMSVEIAGDSSDYETQNEQAQTCENVQKALNSLDEQARMLIVLRDMEGKSYEDISLLLECPLGTVKSRLARARDLLRKELFMYFKDGTNEL